MTAASQVKQTLASMKGIQGTLRTYAIQTRDNESKSIYNEALEVTETIIMDLENRVKTLEFQEPQYKGN